MHGGPIPVRMEKKRPLPWASGNPVAIQCAWNSDPIANGNATGDSIVGSQCVSSCLPVAFQCVPIIQINTGLRLGHHRVLASGGVVPVASQCVCVSNGCPVFQLCKLTPDRHWKTIGRYHQPVWFQWHPSVLVAPVVFQCGVSSGITVYWQNLFWRSLGQDTSQFATIMYTTGMVRVFL